MTLRSRHPILRIPRREFLHRPGLLLPEGFAPLSTVELKWESPWNPSNITALWYRGVLREGPNSEPHYAERDFAPRMTDEESFSPTIWRSSEFFPQIFSVRGLLFGFWANDSWNWLCSQFLVCFGTKGDSFFFFRHQRKVCFFLILDQRKVFFLLLERKEESVFFSFWNKK